MKKILAFNGSPRNLGNTSFMLQYFLEGAGQNTNNLKEIRSHELNLHPCRGCLRCNVLKRCSISDDDWPELSTDILKSDILVFASPIYFHHLPSTLKKVIDRFRSFVHVQITETGLIHTPWEEWRKDIVLLLTMGSQDISDAKPVIELFEYIASILGDGNKLHVITAHRLALTRQIDQSREELENLYTKLKLPLNLVEKDHQANKQVREKCYRLGSELVY
jgi:putative NADPH-quinone reductase